MTVPRYWITEHKIFIDLQPEAVVALCAWGEARGEGSEGMHAVVCVIGNRVRRGGWFVYKPIAEMSTPYHGVVLRPYQFSCFLPSDPNYPKMMRLANNFATAAKEDEAMASALSMASKLISGSLPDITHGAVYYHAETIRPSWAASMTQVAHIGRHIFYTAEVT